MKNEKKIENICCAVIFIIILFILLWCKVNGFNEQTPEPPAKVLTTEDKVKAQFNEWNGSHIELKRIIKASMNDPKSFEHVSTEYIELGGTVYVYTRFRGKNAFGGVVMDELRGEFNVAGELLKISE